MTADAANDPKEHMPEPRRLRDLIAGDENWLTARIIKYAKERGYTPFTSTLEQAWLASIRGLSAPLIAALDEGRPFGAVAAEADYSRDPIALYGIEAAKRHRSRGVTLGLFLGLMKSYRQTYVELVTGPDSRDEDREANRAIVDSFFDRMEVGFCDEWSGRPADEQFEQLRLQNQKITNEKNKYLTIFESLRDPVILIDDSGKVENANHAALTLFAGAAAPGASYYGGARLPIDEILGGALIDGREPTGERQLTTNAGSRWFDIKTQRMLDVSEKYLGAVVILNDVSEHRRAREEAERADRAKSAFLATMSHEIRTPIHGILGLAELLSGGRLDPQQSKYVEAIARSGELLSSVVSDILDYSKIQAGVLDLERIEFELTTVVEDVFGLMLPLVDRKPELRLLVETPQVGTIVGDPGKLRQILLNLVGNAVKFSERGAVTLAVSETAGSNGGRMLRFEVSDTGIGVAPDRLEAIFDPFTQSDVTVSRRFGGSGLGLAICRRLVDRLGGEIGVESLLGEGSRFWFTMPLEPSVGATAAAPDRAAARRKRTSVALDLLVVEDNEVNAMVASGLLARAGHKAIIASSGAEALALFDSREFDAVLMDLRLPDFDGLEVVRRMRASADVKKSRTPIIVQSAHVLASDIEACVAAGVNEFVGKPFKLERLQAALRRVASPAALRRSARRPVVAPAAAIAPPWRPEVAPNAAVDEAVLAEHVNQLGFEQTARIIAAFETSVAGAPAEIERLALAGDRRALAAIAHRLKSSSMHVGLARLSQLAGALEAGASGESLDVAATAVALAAACRDGLVSLERSFARIREGQPANM
jgi:signal transduction histidine kinase/CheY-like chemotaxis protein/HPt (histidine-containing phosphotransfer) domain-containing protein